MILSIPAGNSRPYLDEQLIYSTPAGRPFDTSRQYTFRAKNGEMNRIYDIEHFELSVDPTDALLQLRAGSYRALTADQVQRLKVYIAGTSRNLPGYNEVQDYYFLVSEEANALPNRPQMVPNSTVTKGYGREELMRGGRLKTS